jgi:beta-lactam-binding protein with PASTA domain
VTEPRGGERLLAGRYRVGELIGRGGMADVYLGLDTRLDRRIAIKLLKPALATDSRFRLLFREEAQKAARMAHPTIVRVFDAGEQTSTDEFGVTLSIPFIVMEYVDGRLLKDILADGPLAAGEAVRITSQVLTALEYSHRALLVHRDIKPGNIMVTQNGQVKVMDFGIARAVSDNSATVAETGAILGTAQYFSPEQARGETVDARTDLYSTGVILFELLTGRPPFRGDRPAAVAYQHISEPPATPSGLNPAVSASLDTVVLHALQKDKFERYQSAAEFRADLEAAAAGHLPTRRGSEPDFGQTVFGVNPTERAGSESALRQLTGTDDGRLVRTQPRPPVVWIWASVLVIVAVLVSVLIWVVALPAQQPDLAPSLSVEVPDVVGDEADAGAQELTAVGLAPTVVQEQNADVPAGRIYSTDPSAGSRVDPDQAVTIYVSAGVPPTTVPLVDGLPEADARAALTAQGLVAGATTEEYSATVAAGSVIAGTPASSSEIAPGGVVDLVVSNGLVRLGEVVGQPLATASASLAELQLDITVDPDDTCSGGQVSEQSLPAGDHPQHAAITIEYCAG